VSAPVEVAIIGTGFSGLCMAIQLARRGRRSFVVLERAGRVGGTWRENHYPGCACDVPSHLYSFSFAPNPDWSRAFAPQAEILAYLERCAARFGLEPHIRFDTEATEARFDEATGTWTVSTSRGAPVYARHLVVGIGGLNKPAIPALPGLARFAGTTFHSARWNHEYPLDGKTVAVVGTGASAVQFVPRIAPRVDRLHLFQRSAPWVLPKPDRAIGPRERRLYRLAPALQRLARYAIYARMEARGLGFTVHPRLLAPAAALGVRHLRAHVADPALRAALTPDYAPGCKRILQDDDYYPALTRPNVEVVTDGIAEITARGVVTRDGVERPVDAIIWGTGFQIADALTPLRIHGRGDIELSALWRGGMEAYLGTTIAGFPNMYFLTGPNTGLGHNSMVFMIEAQVHYILALMRAMERRGADVAEVRPATQRHFNERLQPRLGRGVWASGCQSWYLDERGRNTALWPGPTVEFWLRTRRVRARDYAFSTAAEAAAPARDRASRSRGGPIDAARRWRRAG
jgi:cation diffusion facilitator CzcD-associated flavoprotein CzcO